MNDLADQQWIDAFNQSLADAVALAPEIQAASPISVWVALSGGLDSVVLLRQWHRLAGSLSRAVTLNAVHVNHQLSPNAGAWEAFVSELCRDLEVPLKVARVTVTPSGGGFEEAARQARYQVFEEVLKTPGVLALAHHLDDQLETLLLRLTRGTGLRGMAGMPAKRVLAAGVLVRPLLAFSRAALEQVAHTRGWTHVTDESNADQRFDRNFMRHTIAAPLQARFAGVAKHWAEAMQAAREAQQLVADLARVDAEALGAVLDAPDPYFAVAPFAALDEARQRNFLREFISAVAEVSLTRPHLLELQQQVVRAAAAPRLVLPVGAGELRYFAGSIYWVRARARAAIRLVAARASGAGLFLRGTPSDYQLAPRLGGERCRPAGRVHSQTLKKLLQERGVPPWQREQLTLIWSGSTLAAVGNYWICDGFVAENDQLAVKILSLNESCAEA